MPCICFRECGRTASSQDDCNLCEADGDCQSHSWADNPATSWSVNDWQVLGAALRSQPAISHSDIQRHFCLLKSTRGCSIIFHILHFPLKDIKGVGILGLSFLRKERRMIGDATCCLLTCEGMIAHHLITSIYTRVAGEATIFSFYNLPHMEAFVTPLDV